MSHSASYSFTYVNLVKLFAVAVATYSLFIILVPDITYAQKDNSSAADSTSSTQVTQDASEDGTYVFVAKSGDSQSLIVRRAIQLYDENKSDVTLSPEAAMYAETKIVKELGSRYLEINEKVNVPLSLIRKHTEASLSLPADKLALWSVYVKRADYGLARIVPAAESTGPVATTEDANVTPEADEDQSETNSEETTSNEDTTWYWWVLAAVVLGVGFYLWSGRPTPKPRD